MQSRIPAITIFSVLAAFCPTTMHASEAVASASSDQPKDESNCAIEEPVYDSKLEIDADGRPSDTVNHEACDAIRISYICADSTSLLIEAPCDAGLVRELTSGDDISSCDPVLVSYRLFRRGEKVSPPQVFPLTSRRPIKVAEEGTMLISSAGRPTFESAEIE